MITYDQGYWGLSFAVRLHGSVFPKSFCWGLPAALAASLVHIALDSIPGSRETLAVEDVGASVLSGFTFILGFLIVFRSQQAYSRWWEGGTLLQQLRGEWFNAFSSLMAFCNTSKEKTEGVLNFQHRLLRLVSLLYASALEQVTTIHKPHLEVFELDGFELDHFAFMQTSHDRCEIVLQWLQRLIIDADRDGVIKVAPPILSRVYNQLGNGIVNLNNARKITDFPIPFPLAQMVTFMLCCHFGITIIVCAASVRTAAWAGFLSFLVVFSFWSINYIAIELEMPFGDDHNDLPLREMQTDLNKSLVHLMHPSAQTCPDFVYSAVHACFHTTETHLDEYLADLHPGLFPQQDAKADIHGGTTFKDLLGTKVSIRMMRAKQSTEHIKEKTKKRSQRNERGEREVGPPLWPDAAAVKAERSTRGGTSMVSISTASTLAHSSGNAEDTSIDEAIAKARSHGSGNQKMSTSPPKLGAKQNEDSGSACDARPLIDATQDSQEFHRTAVLTVPVQRVPQARAQAGQARVDENALPTFDYSSVDMIWLSKCMGEYLCRIARELRVLRDNDMDVNYSGTAPLVLWGGLVPENLDAVMGAQNGTVHEI